MAEARNVVLAITDSCHIARGEVPCCAGTGGLASPLFYFFQQLSGKSASYPNSGGAAISVGLLAVRDGNSPNNQSENASPVDNRRHGDVASTLEPRARTTGYRSSCLLQSAEGTEA
jgi:hypothetical protein